jgi:hypothetical protein
LVCAFLEFGALAGVPMRPEQIAELMERLSRPRLAHVLPEDHERDGGQPPRQGHDPVD